MSTHHDHDHDASPGAVAAWTAHLPVQQDTFSALPVLRPDRLPDVWPGLPGNSTAHRPAATATTGTGLDLGRGRDAAVHDQDGRDSRDGLGVDWTEARILLGPDWRAIAGFMTFVAALVGGAVVGEVLASSTGGLAGAMTGGTVFAVVAYLRNRRRLVELTGIPADWHDEPATAGTSTAAAAVERDPLSGSGFDSVRSTARPAPARSERASVPVFVWVCEDCDLRSTPVVTWVEARHLALTHDRLHHGRPVAAIESRHVPAHLLLNAGSSWLTASALPTVPGTSRRPVLGRGPSGERR